MAYKIIHLSRHVIKRVVIGLIIGIAGFSAIYYLGFNKTPSRPSEAEIRDNTIKTWKSYIGPENDMAVNSESNYKRFTRKAVDRIAYKKSRQLNLFRFYRKAGKIKRNEGC
jgi:hypothetical protein